ncbi:F-box/LRR-repeat protein 7 [Ceratitis capitata]|nr:F-box/LRR-repeat protein 7 [Ceratitis capitata]
MLSNLLSLDNKCLERICSFLSTRSLVRFAKVCPRLYDIVQGHCISRYKTCEFFNVSKMTLPEIVRFFLLAGAGIESLERYAAIKHRDIVIDLMATYCPQMKTLVLINCDLDDNSMSILKNLKTLQTLTLASSARLTGKHINNLVHLTHLNLYNCSNMRTSHLIQIFKDVPNLRALDMRECRQMTPELFTEMVKYCKQLEVLKTSCPEFPYSCVAILPNLKELVLSEYIPGATTQIVLLQELVANKAKQLEVLEIYSENSLNFEHVSLISKLKHLKVLNVANNQVVNDDALVKFGKLKQLEVLTIRRCVSITNQGVLKLLQSCSLLYRLNVQYCTKITNEFVINVIPVLSDNRSHNRKKPFLLLVDPELLDEKTLALFKQYTIAVKEFLIKIDTEMSESDLAYGPYWKKRPLSDGEDSDETSRD